MTTIFEIAKDRLELFKLLEENDWDVSVIQDTLDGDGLDDKINDWLRVIANAEGTAKAIKAEKEALAERQKQFENQAKNMKKALHQVMQNLGHKTYKVALGTLSRSDVASAIKFDETELSEDYVLIDTVKTPDKQKIEMDMNAGIDVPGAYFEIQPERFSIRRK
ncbi:siphovirus Gp157 family protein [Vibrio harveyi]|uniref:siphovirus Gp157 family protein n=1 Tax=Vibrio harveyi TaxID=669 RepID=UPI00217CDEC7|nr:siphovirus Gp157 family protein [Vibrio harveyi]